MRDFSRLRRAASVAVRRWANRDVIRVWNAWGERAASRSRDTRLLYGALNAARSRGLRQSFNALKAIGASSERLLRLSRAAAVMVGGLRSVPLGERPSAGAEMLSPEAGRSLLMRIVRAWARWSLDWRAHLRRHAEAARGSLRGVSHLLSPEERSTWPRVWKRSQGWPNDLMTWREATQWLVELKVSIPNLSTSLRPDGMGLQGGHVGGIGIANSPAATRLLAAVREGHVYTELLERVRQMRHEAEVEGVVLPAPVKHFRPSSAPTTAETALPASVVNSNNTTTNENRHLQYHTMRPEREARRMVTHQPGRDRPPLVEAWTPDGRLTKDMAPPSMVLKTPAAKQKRPPIPKTVSTNATSAPFAEVKTATTAPEFAPIAAEWQLGDGRRLQGERFFVQDDSWRDKVNAFFKSDEAFEALGHSCKEISIGAGGGRAVEHLSALTALRVVCEMHEPTRWARFVSERSAEHLSHPRRVALPRFTAPHHADDGTACPPGAARAFVCLGCPTPRILLERMKCGRCNMKATTPVEEYLSVSAVPSAAYYVVDCGTRREAKKWATPQAFQ